MLSFPVVILRHNGVKGVLREYAHYAVVEYDDDFGNRVLVVVEPEDYITIDTLLIDHVVLEEE